jgi:hypothetical protein
MFKAAQETDASFDFCVPDAFLYGDGFWSLTFVKSLDNKLIY